MVETILDSRDCEMRLLSSGAFRALGEFHQGVAFCFFQKAPFPRFEIIEREASDAESHEPLHSMADRLDHVADLSFQSGIEDHFESPRRDSFDGHGFGFPDFGEDSFFQLSEDRVFEGILGGDLVEFFNLVAGVSQRL